MSTRRSLRTIRWASRLSSPQWVLQQLAGLVAFAFPLLAAPSVRWVDNADHPNRPWVEATLPDSHALPENLRAQRTLLTVAVAPADPAKPNPPMAGTYSLHERTLRFDPQFPLEAGLTYLATLHLGPDAGNPPPASLTIPPPGDLPPPARVSKITPTADTLPFNLLKFYLHFSAPMTRGEVYRHIVLRDDEGQPVEDPFLELPEELWDPEMKRLTVLLDPGRIKRGLLPHEIVGAVLEEGKQYTLTIDPAWKDASGQPLAQRGEKTFRAGPADYTQPDPAKWRYHLPATATKEPLEIAFAEPLDAALASRLIVVRDVAGNIVRGSLELPDSERRWVFTPAQPWQDARYEVHLDHRIEDLAGNSIERRFEEGLDRHPDQAGAPPGHTLRPFTPLPPPAGN